jgi:hypothetical protein
LGGIHGQTSSLFSTMAADRGVSIRYRKTLRRKSVNI